MPYFYFADLQIKYVLVIFGCVNNILQFIVKLFYDSSVRDSSTQDSYSCFNISTGFELAALRVCDRHSQYSYYENNRNTSIIVPAPNETRKARNFIQVEFSK